ncbi:hypothetical protein [Vibrio methylphosphonaticus]|uniref:hypothetical protein n=1 Tax=Vibrio methylphosphonaticus TaxID=2946866 RepID=UPI00202A08E7|nr:hypothetical protein [Vibrio methylphosphonaticus]MCL9773666.1 hypothetical protein [Vibrio methylphosphonaticus]
MSNTYSCTSLLELYSTTKHISFYEVSNRQPVKGTTGYNVNNDEIEKIKQQPFAALLGKVN